VERIVKASSNPGDLVLDPFVGSGTACRVSQILGRKWIGIDVNPKYIEMAQKRLNKTFEGFDSYDPRTERTPLDIPSSTSRRQISIFEGITSKQSPSGDSARKSRHG
jgi:site-specific DNA-methyltransferase (adenine-specific)